MRNQTINIAINDSRKILDIQDEFNAVFPYLKMEFFSRPHKNNEGSARKLMLRTQQTLGECRTRHVQGELKINPEMTVLDLEQGFNEMYGLNIQVFRKSGKVWLETTVTDGWTLDEQNRQGEELSSIAG